MARRLTRDDAIDIIKSHILSGYKMETSVLQQILPVLEQVERGTSRGMKACTTCCEVTEQARAFIAGQPVTVDAVTSMAAYIVAQHSIKGGVKHVA